MRSKMQVRLRSVRRLTLMSELRTVGFLSPSVLFEERELRITVTDGDSVYDAAFPGGLKVNR